MQGNGRYVMRAMIVAVLGLTASGCFLPQDVGTALLVSPERLDFGLAKDKLTLRISKNFTASTQEPLVIQVDQPWIVPEACTDPAENCLSIGPIDGIRVPIRVDRQKMNLGVNVGTLILLSGGASVKTVQVVAQDTLKADFDASSRTAEVGHGISFADLSASSEEPIVSRVWNFGDGNTSAEAAPFHAYQTQGQYDVTLTIRTAKREETINKTAFITVGSTAPVANFYASSTTVFEGTVVQFTDQSTSAAAAITQRLWDFGDGTTSTEINPSHQYLKSGTFTVSLTASTASANHTATRTNYIIVQRKIAPEAKFALSQAKPYIGVPVEFRDLSEAGTAPITKWVWEFGDGVASTQQNPTRAYKQVGTYQVKLTVITAHGVNSKIVPIDVVYMPPAADFRANDLIPSAGDEVEFTDLSLPGSEPISTWEWDFGDRTNTVITRVPGVLENGNTTHAYAKPGTYTVTLKVTIPVPSNNTDIEEKVDYLVVYDAPEIDFELETTSPVVGKEVRFENLTQPGSESQITYEWDFGDPSSTGNISTEVNGRHTYARAGVYSVILTAITPTRRVESEPMQITVDAPPVPGFTFTPAQPATGENVQFQDQSSDAGTRPILGRVWDFGDAQTSNALNPVHKYLNSGTYTVKLRLVFRHSVSGASLQTDPITKTLAVTAPVPPIARFRAESPCAMTGIPVQFVDLSTNGSRPITEWLWDFGNGARSTERSPQYTYPLPGTYAVTLTVRTSAGLESTMERRDYIEVMSGGSAIDRFVRTPDANYDWTTPVVQTVNYVGPTGTINLGTSYVTRLTSQAWRTAADIYSDLRWEHNLTVINPARRTNDTALLYIDGGSRTSLPPDDDELELMGELAAASGSVVAWIDNVPCQPIVFQDEVEDGVILRKRSEDAIIAYSYDRFMTTYTEEGGDTTWPVLFPMAKAAVRAMDTAQAILDEIAPPSDFVVTGGSKRGWTTWLTGLTDCRIKAIAPIVIDVLNMDEQMEHHRNTYGYWAPSIYEYAQMRVFDRLLPGSGSLSPAAEALLQLVDPYEYRNRMSSIPVFMMNSTGDEFFLPDSARFYFNNLPNTPAEKCLNYVPNTSHGLASDMSWTSTPVQNLMAWFLAKTQNKAIPKFTADYSQAGTITVTITDPSQVRSVRFWQVTNPLTRDFRLETTQALGVSWQSNDATTAGQSVYSMRVNAPPAGYTAFFVQMTFKNPAQLQISVPGLTAPDLVFTTQVRVTPDIYPAFDGLRTTVGGIPLLVLHGTASEMGQQYGRLMSTEIRNCLTNYVLQSNINPTLLDAAWAQQSPRMDARIRDEIAGIATGSGLINTTVQRAHMVDVLRQYPAYSSASAAAWNTATGMPEAMGVAKPLLHSFSYNIPALQQGGMQDYPAVVLYVPDDGFPHAIFTAAGLTTGHAGVNLGGVSIAEVADVNDAVLTSEQHFLFAQRSILYDSSNLREGLTLLRTLMPTRAHHYIMGDGRFELRGAKARRDSQGFTTWLENDPADEFAPNVLPYVVYSVQPVYAEAMFSDLGTNFGFLDTAFFRDFANDFGLATKNALNVVMDTTSFAADVAYAKGTQEAYRQTYVSFDFQAQLP